MVQNEVHILFSLYMLLLGHIVPRHAISSHLYVNDTQLYVPVNS